MTLDLSRASLDELDAILSARIEEPEADPDVRESDFPGDDTWQDRQR
jgi:hypothetical protein